MENNQVTPVKEIKEVNFKHYFDYINSLYFFDTLEHTPEKFSKLKVELITRFKIQPDKADKILENWKECFKVYYDWTQNFAEYKTYAETYNKAIHDSGKFFCRDSMTKLIDFVEQAGDDFHKWSKRFFVVCYMDDMYREDLELEPHFEAQEKENG